MRRAVHFAELAFAFFGLYFMLGGLAAALTPQGATESSAVQLLGMAIGGGAALALIVRPRAASRMVYLYWLAFLAPALAAFSLLWAVDPTLAFRRSGSLFLTVIFAIWLAERFDQKVLFRLLLAACVLLCAASWYTVLFNPRMGVHQPNDGFGLEHVGAWRGVYAFKNDFGRAIALCAMVFGIAGVWMRKYWYVFAFLFVQAFILILNSRSSQAMFLSVVPFMAYVLITWLRTMTARTRTLVIAAILPLLVIAYMTSQLLFSQVLALLGRDGTLTGRTEIWAAVIQSMQSHFLFGGGFGSGWEIVKDRVTVMTGVTVGHAHNGYLDLLTDLGIVGLLVVLVLPLTVLSLSIRNLFSPDAGIIAALGFSYVVFYLAGNAAASFLLLHNSIYWVIPITAYCGLRQIYNPYARPAPGSDPRPKTRILVPGSSSVSSS